MKCLFCDFEFEPPLPEEHLKVHNITLADYLKENHKILSTKYLLGDIKIPITNDQYKIIEKLKKRESKELTGKEVFDYYQSYGLRPIQLTASGLTIDDKALTEYCNLCLDHKIKAYETNMMKGLGRNYRKK